MQIILILAPFFSKNDASNSQERVISMGVGPKPSTSVQNVNNTVFISSNPIINSGVLFGVSAYFVSNMPAHFQLWRLKSGNQYTLIYDYLYTCTDKVPVSLDIILASCTPVQPGDLLGIFFEKSPWPIPSIYYEKIATLQTVIDPMPSVNSVYSIDPLHFPYIFSIYSWILNDAVNNVSDWTRACPTDVSIPKVLSTTAGSSTPRPPLTGAMGSTGDTGQQGPAGSAGQIGSTGFPGATGFTGPDGPPGLPGLIGSTGRRGEKGSIGEPGPIGANGTMGVRGATGFTGPMGPPGLPGPDADPKSNPSTGESTGEQLWWRRESLITGMYIWLAILSFLFLVCFIWSAVLCFKFKKLKGKDLASSRNHLIKD